MGVSTEAAQFFFAVLTLLAGVGSLGIIGLRVATRWSDGATEWLGDIYTAAILFNGSGRKSSGFLPLGKQHTKF